MKIYTGKDLREINPELQSSLNDGNIIGNGFLRKGKSWIVSGYTGTGKSVFAIQLSCHLSMGIDLLGMKIHAPKKVLYIDTETLELDFIENFHGVTGNLKERNDTNTDLIQKNLTIVRKNKIFTIENFLEFLELAIEKYLPEIVIVDSLASSVLCDYSDWDSCNRLFYGGFNSLKAQFNCAIVCIAHFGKGKLGRKTILPSYWIEGCSRITDWANSLSAIMPNSDGSFYIRHDKNFENIEQRYTRILQSDDCAKPFWRLA